MIHKRKSFTLPKYILTFVITAIIFALGFFLSSYLNNRRFLEINRTKREFEMKILGMETQLNDFRQALCPDIGNDILTHELHAIGEMLQVMENNLGKNHPEVISLKNYYSLLQIRHYHLSQELCQRCNLGLIHVLYFYADEKYCPDCEKQGFILTSLREQYPELRIYSFDYYSPLLAIDTIRPLRPEPIIKTNIKPNAKANTKSLIQEYNLPVIVIEGKPFWGFMDLEEMQSILQPKLVN